MGLGREFVETGFDKQYVIQAMRRIKMNDFVVPGDVLTTKLTLSKKVENTLILRVLVSRSEQRVCLLELVMVECPKETHA